MVQRDWRKHVRSGEKLPVADTAKGARFKYRTGAESELLMMSINNQTILRSLFKRSLIAILMAVAWGGAKATETPAAQHGLQLRWDQKGLYASPYDFVTGDWKIEGADAALQLAALTEIGRAHV